MSALQKENPRPLAKAKPKLRQNVLREKLKKQRQELARDVVALESNVIKKSARELDDQRAIGVQGGRLDVTSVCVS